MGGFFQYDSTFSRVLNRVVDFFYASVLWLIACIPIITIGTSTTALFTVARRTLKEDRGYVFQTFKDTFRTEFKQTTIMWLIELGIYLVLAFCRMIMRVFLEQGSPLGFMFYIYYYAILYEIVYCIFTFAYASRFKLGIKGTMINCAILTLKYLPVTILFLVMIVVSLRIIMDMPFFAFVLPAVLVWIFQYFLEKIFRKIMTFEDRTRIEEEERNFH